MLISHSRRLILFANPKTGSRSLRELFTPLAEETVTSWRQRTARQPFYTHISPQEVLEIFQSRGWNFWEYRRITSIRNPFPRLVSLYRMIEETDRVWRLRRRIGLGVPDFDDWLRNISADGRGAGGRRHQRWRRFGSWSAENWIHDGDGRRLVTDILRLEDLARLAPELLREHDLPAAPLQTLNARRPVAWRNWYSAGSRELIAARYAWDLAHFYPEELAEPPATRVS